MKVLDIRLLPVHGSKPTRAFADLELDGITIRDFRVYQQNGKPAVRNPFSTYKDHEGSLTFREIISLPGTVQAEAHALILNAYFHRLKEMQHGETTE
ncbi:MAG: hypothetical protein ABSC55_20745 [Syntrophorhabdales bacterium]|jgi:hypothetical protein